MKKFLVLATLLTVTFGTVQGARLTNAVYGNWAGIRTEQYDGQQFTQFANAKVKPSSGGGFKISYVVYADSGVYTSTLNFMANGRCYDSYFQNGIFVSSGSGRWKNTPRGLELWSGGVLTRFSMRGRNHFLSGSFNGSTLVTFNFHRR